MGFYDKLMSACQLIVCATGCFPPQTVALRDNYLNTATIGTARQKGALKKGSVRIKCTNSVQIGLVNKS
jgi:hypothetical protein